MCSAPTRSERRSATAAMFVSPEPAPLVSVALSLPTRPTGSGCPSTRSRATDEDKKLTAVILNATRSLRERALERPSPEAPPPRANASTRPGGTDRRPPAGSMSHMRSWHLFRTHGGNAITAMPPGPPPPALRRAARRRDLWPGPEECWSPKPGMAGTLAITPPRYTHLHRTGGPGDRIADAHPRATRQRGRGAPFRRHRAAHERGHGAAAFG